MLKTSTKYFPLFLMLFYILFGIACSIFSPLGYLNYDLPPVLLFMSAVVVCMIVGYMLGIVQPVAQKEASDPRSVMQHFHVITIASFALSAATITYVIFDTITSKGLNLNIFKSGEAYVSNYDLYERNTGTYSPVFLITTFASPMIFVSTIWGLYYFRSLNQYMKVALIYILVATFVVFTIGDGKQKQFGDIMIYIACIYALKKAAAGKLNAALLGRFALLGVAGVCVLLILLSSRYGAVGIDVDNLGAVLHPLMTFDEKNWVVAIFGKNVGFPLAMLSSYFGQGYYGLSLALQQPFTWTNFAGGSYSVSVIVNLLGGPFMVEQSYPYLVGDATGWSESKWHTAYSWLASDLTWPGTALFTGFVSYVYAVAWKEAILVRNPFSILVFCLLSIGAAYLPANNQLMHSPGALLTLIVVFALYYWYRGAVNYHNLKTFHRRNARSAPSVATA